MYRLPGSSIAASRDRRPRPAPAAPQQRVVDRVAGQRALRPGRVEARTRSPASPGDGDHDQVRLARSAAGAAAARRRRRPRPRAALRVGRQRRRPRRRPPAAGSPRRPRICSTGRFAEGDAQRHRHQEREAVDPEDRLRLAVELAQPGQDQLPQRPVPRRRRSVARRSCRVGLVVAQVPAGQRARTRLRGWRAGSSAAASVAARLPAAGRAAPAGRRAARPTVRPIAAALRAGPTAPTGRSASGVGDRPASPSAARTR